MKSPPPHESTDSDGAINTCSSTTLRRLEIFISFAKYLKHKENMSESVFKNCVKWMQKNLEWQCIRQSCHPPKAYITRLPGIKDISKGLRVKELERRATAEAKDLQLIHKLQHEGHIHSPAKDRRFAI